jgi:hypothetical protein
VLRAVLVLVLCLCLCFRPCGKALVSSSTCLASHTALSRARTRFVQCAHRPSLALLLCSADTQRTADIPPEEALLRAFDLDTAFGPCTGMTRLERCVAALCLPRTAGCRRHTAQLTHCCHVPLLHPAPQVAARRALWAQPAARSEAAAGHPAWRALEQKSVGGAPLRGSSGSRVASYWGWVGTDSCLRRSHLSTVAGMQRVPAAPTAVSICTVCRCDDDVAACVLCCG